MRTASWSACAWRRARRRRGVIAPVALMLAIGAVLASPAPAAAGGFAPLHRPGPPLSVPVAKLRAALACQPGVRDAPVAPVLLSPGTGVTPDQNFSWNWQPALDELGIPWCTYTPPYRTLGNIDVSGEYLVYAVRTVYALAQRPIAIIGHSQGGMSMRWALRFWPDTRVMVDDVIGFAADNHGTTVTSEAACARGCPPADWQQMDGSRFMQALNSEAETFPGISYTEVYTHTDEVVQPSRGPRNCSPCLYTGAGMITNVATQDICPAHVYEHSLIGTLDTVAYRLALDALTHPGPADATRIPRSACLQPYMPGVDPADVGNDIKLLSALLPVAARPPATAGLPRLKSEPPLPCYVFDGCTRSTAGRAHRPRARCRSRGRAPARRARRPSASFRRPRRCRTTPSVSSRAAGVARVR